MNVRRNNAELVAQYKVKIHNAIISMQYSYIKASGLSTKYDELNDEDLQIWESLAARFSRAVEIIAIKYLRLKVLLEDPGFNGSVCDFLNRAEKLDLIESAESWFAICSMKNVSDYDCTDEEISEYFWTLLKMAPTVLRFKV